jgi:hypothetical protein
MAIRGKASEVKNQSRDDRSLSDMYFRVPANSEHKIVILEDFADISSFGQYGFGQGSNFWTIIDTGESDDLGKRIGLYPKTKYITPIVYFNDETKSWSEPVYYQFPISVYQQLALTYAAIDTKRKEDENEGLRFKGAILTLVRNDKTANGFPAYTVQWVGDMWGKTKSTKNLELPVSDLNLDLGVAGDCYSDIESEIKEKILAKLIEHSDYRFPDTDKNNVTLGETIGERLVKIGALTESSTNDEWDNLDAE